MIRSSLSVLCLAVLLGGCPLKDPLGCSEEAPQYRAVDLPNGLRTIIVSADGICSNARMAVISVRTSRNEYRTEVMEARGEPPVWIGPEFPPNPGASFVVILYDEDGKTVRFETDPVVIE